MSNDHIPDRPRTMTEDQMMGVIQRAAEIDAHSADRVSLDTLYRLAEEVGVSRSAVETALAEGAGRDSVPALSPVWRVLGFGVLSLAVGIGATVASHGGTSEVRELLRLVMFGAPGLALFASALRSKGRGSQVVFQACSVAAWLGLFAGSSLALDVLVGPYRHFSDIIVGGLMSMSALGGGLIVALRQRASRTLPSAGGPRTPDVPHGEMGPSILPSHGWMRRALERLWTLRRLRLSAQPG